jgi:RHS repeat-associated protein
VQRLTGLTNVRAGVTITSHAYTLDNEGDRTALSEFVSGITPAGQTDGFTMTYDGLLRLTGVALTNPETFTLDAASNVAARTGPAKTFSYDQANRLTNDGAQAYTWSAADRLVQRGADTFAYDALDRLTSSAVGGVPRSYTYDGDGLLSSRLTPLATTFLWDPASAPQRLLQAGTDRIVHGLGPLYVARADGTTTTLARDGGKSVRAEVSDLGLVTGSWRYRAYGETAQASGLGPSILGYAGQLTDPSGLLYMRARWYDPTTGRFMTADPVAGNAQVPATMNAYLYAAANPSVLSDPAGLRFIADDPSGACDETCRDSQPDFEIKVGLTLRTGTATTVQQGALIFVPVSAGPLTSYAAAGAPAAKRGGETPKAAEGRKRHKELGEQVEEKEGWRSEPRIRGADGRWYRPDVVTPKGRIIELKPRTPSGIYQGQRQLANYEEQLGMRGRLLYYEP